MIIKVSKETRKVYLTKAFIGNDGENLQETIEFEFTDEFVNGQGRLEYELGGQKYHLPLSKDNQKYSIPVKNVITKEGKPKMQLVIVEQEENEEIPIFKSNTFYVYCSKSINAKEEAPDQYEYWLDVIEAKLDEVDNINIEAERTTGGVNVSITDRHGETTTTPVYDGEKGNGITDISKTSTSGLVDTYTINYDNGDTDTYEVTNGEDGHTPVKGTDYWTQQDKAEIVGDTITEITPTLNLKQNIIDNTLQTTNKSVPSAINEVNLKSSNNASDIDTIEEKIPNQATSINQLADKDFVNSSLNSITAFYITKNVNGDAFSTKAELNQATTFYSGGEVRVPTRNDYCVVLADESKVDPVTGENPTTRYIYNNGWEYQYTVNKTSLTSDQLNAINSGITSGLVQQIGTNQNNISNIKDGTTLDSFADVENELNGYVQFTDYASQNVGGVVKMWTSLNEDNEIGLNISTE